MKGTIDRLYFQKTSQWNKVENTDPLPCRILSGLWSIIFAILLDQMISKETPQKDPMFTLKMEKENDLDMTVRDAVLDYLEVHVLYILSHKRELF